MPSDIMLLGAGLPPGDQFAPGDIAGLKLNIDFSLGSSLTLTDDNDVAAVRDRSVNNLLFTQATASLKPEIRLLGSRNGAMFDGIDDKLRVASQPLTGNVGHAFGVIRFPSLPSTHGNILCAGDENGSQAMDCLRTERIGGINYFSVASGASLANRVRGNTVIAINTTYVVSVATNGSAWSIRVNGLDQTLSVVQGSNVGGWYNDVPLADTLTIGWLDINTAAAYFRGLVGELLVYDGVTLTAEQIDQVEAYLADKWAATLV